MVIDDGLEGSQVLCFVECCPCGFLPAFFDTAVNDGRSGSQREQDGEDDKVLLVAVEKFLEGVGALGNFSKRHGSIREIGGHDVG